MRVIIHKQIEVLERLIPTWEILHKKFRDITVFQDISWLKSWWNFESKKSNISPYIVEIKNEDRTVGILPFYLSLVEFANLTFRILQPMGNHRSDYIIPILSKACSSDELLDLAFNAIYKDQKSWDYIEWDDIPESATFARFLTKSSFKFYVEGRRHNTCPYFVLNGDFEVAKSQFNYKLLKDVLYKERKLKREGIVTFSRVLNEEEIEPIMNKLFELHNKRWQGTPTPSQFRYAEEREYALCAAKELHKSRLLNLAYICLNNEIIAVNFGMMDGKKSYFYLHAFDIAYRKYSPGQLLLYYLVQQACREKLKVIDLMRGDEGYKGKWRTGVNHNVKYEFFNRSLKSRAYRFLFHQSRNQRIIRKVSAVFTMMRSLARHRTSTH